MNAREFKTMVAILLVLITVQAVSADTIHNIVRRGNKLYNKGNFSEAIKEYDQALIDQPQSLQPRFNKANCYFQLDDLDRAMDLYNEVAAESKDMKLVAMAKYNLGNCYFKRGSKQKDSNLQKSLEDLQTSIVCWRGALEIDAENEKAAKNIEVARLIIKDIIDRINKEKQKQQQQAEKQKQMQEQLKKILEQQKALAETTGQTARDANEGKISQQQAEDDYKNQAQQQMQLKSETEQASQQIQQQDPNTAQPPQMQQAGSELEQAVDAQSDAETKLKASDADAAKKSQDKAIEHLENALKQLSGDSQQNKQQQQQQQQTQQPGQPNEEQQQGREEQKAAVVPDTAAQEILDKEQQEKKQRQMLRQSGYQKVDKDW